MNIQPIHVKGPKQEDGRVWSYRSKTITHTLVLGDKKAEFERHMLANGWQDSREMIFDAHYLYKKGWTASFCDNPSWDLKQTISFSHYIDDGWDVWESKEAHDAYFDDRESKGYVVARGFKIDNAPTVRWSDMKFKKYNPLERAQERAKNGLNREELLWIDVEKKD